jgi:hypothetical protein
MSSLDLGKAYLFALEATSYIPDYEKYEQMTAYYGVGFKKISRATIDLLKVYSNQIRVLDSTLSNMQYTYLSSLNMKTYMSEVRFTSSKKDIIKIHKDNIMAGKYELCLLTKNGNCIGLAEIGNLKDINISYRTFLMKTLRSFIIDPKYHHMGYGKFFMKYILFMLWKKLTKKLITKCLVPNYVGNDFFKSVGFTKISNMYYFEASRENPVNLYGTKKLKSTEIYEKYPHVFTDILNYYNRYYFSGASDIKVSPKSMISNLSIVYSFFKVDVDKNLDILIGVSNFFLGRNSKEVICLYDSSKRLDNDSFNKIIDGILKCAASVLGFKYVILNVPITQDGLISFLNKSSKGIYFENEYIYDLVNVSIKDSPYYPGSRS